MHGGLSSLVVCFSCCICVPTETFPSHAQPSVLHRKDDSATTSLFSVCLQFAFLCLIPGEVRMYSLEDREQPVSTWCLPRTQLSRRALRGARGGLSLPTGEPSLLKRCRPLRRSSQGQQRSCFSSAYNSISDLCSPRVNVWEHGSNGGPAVSLRICPARPVLGAPYIISAQNPEPALCFSYS